MACHCASMSTTLFALPGTQELEIVVERPSGSSLRNAQRWRPEEPNQEPCSERRQRRVSSRRQAATVVETVDGALHCLEDAVTIDSCLYCWPPENALEPEDERWRRRRQSKSTQKREREREPVQLAGRTHTAKRRVPVPPRPPFPFREKLVRDLRLADSRECRTREYAVRTSMFHRA